MSRPAREQARAVIAAELAFFALTCTAAFGFCRLFIGWSFLPPLLLAAAGSHLLAAACRRRGWNVAAALAASVAGLAVLTTLLYFRPFSLYGLPTRGAWDAMWVELEASWSQFATAIAPVRADTGYMVAAVIGVWGAAFLADSFAFRALASVEAILPSGILFVFASALGADSYRWLCTATWLGAAILAFALHRTMAQDGGGWLAGIRRGTLGSVARTSALIGAVVVALALVVGPTLPGAGEEAILDTKEGGSGTRQTVSPLVDIQGRIVDRSDVEMFTVVADGKSYWRLTALDEFDGRLWTSERGYGEADGTLAGGLPPQLTLPLNQEFTIGAIDAIWLPAAYSPERIDISQSVRYDEESASLVTRRNEVEPGTTYRVVSRVPLLEPATLDRAIEPPPEDITEHYLTLPDDYPAPFRLLAAEIAGAGTTPYQRAKLLQDWFQANFTYDLAVPRGHSNNAIANFLEIRRGYCEQFAGTFAAFARSLGIPSRVAVGFTPGELREDGRYHVLGKHMHAWPEVYLTGIGWVPFEPTPSRGIPGAETYTGVPAAQEGEVPQAPSTTVAPATTVPGTATTLPPGFDEGLFPPVDPGFTGVPGLTEQAESSWAPRVLIVLVALVVLAGLWLLLAPRLVRARWDRRRRSATTGAERVLVTWRQATDLLARNGTPAAPSETPLEFAERLTAAHDPDADLVRQLADHVTVAAYSGDDVSDDVVAATDDARRQLEHRRWARAGWKDRLRYLADPRPLLRRRLPGDEDVTVMDAVGQEGDEREPVSVP